ncbi:MAG: LysR family transcriptional regulator [Planctomycetota bacterium]|jgi:DNA-binding transcriptional LysR family regulator
MNPHHLRTFLAVRKHLNYTHAAQDLFLSQPAVSRQVRQLERELGVRLFEQIGKSLHPTDAGETLTREAEKILGALERTAEAVRAHRSAEHGSLRVGASTTPGFYLLPGLLGRFHARYPRVDLRYAVENSLRIEQMIVRNELDLGFVGAHLAHDDLDLERLVDDEIVCFAGPSHPLAGRRRIAPRSLEKHTWIIREKGSATRRLFESWLARNDGATGLTIELHSPEAIKALVAAGVGFSFMSVHALKDELRRKRLKRLPVTGLRLRRPIYLVRHTHKHTSPVMETFLAIVRAALADERRRARSG